MELGVDEPAARAIHDEQQIVLLRTSTSPADAWERLARQAFLTADGHQRAEAIVLRRTVDAAGDALRGGDYRRSLRLLQ